MEAGAELIERIRMISGSGNILTDPVALSAYRSDRLRRHGPLPLAVALPGDSGEVAATVRAAADLGISWVVRGAGTSVEGGAAPRSGALLITLSRMRRILAVNLADDELTVEAGVPSVAVRSAVAPTHRFPFEHAGTVGGAAAQGVLWQQLAALTLVEPDGSVVSFDTRMPGYDITAAFAGSRGTRGIAVALTLRAVPAT